MHLISMDHNSLQSNNYSSNDNFFSCFWVALEMVTHALMPQVYKTYVLNSVSHHLRTSSLKGYSRVVWLSILQ